jgi:endonuclease YncB( thermonuclease family)
VPFDHAACVRPQQADGHLHLWFEHDPIGKPVPTFPDHAVFPLNGMRKICEHGVMVSSAATSSARGIAIMLCAILSAIASGGSVRAEGCLLRQQGEGRVADVVDGRSVHLAYGREILLAGIEPAESEATRADRAAALSAVIADHDVTLRGEDDTPDRYGPQTAFFLAGSETPVQAFPLAQGAALVSADIADRDCVANLFAAEAEARAGQRGIWASLSAIKNAESPDDILAGIGRFTVVEGKVLSVRQAGAKTFLNFGRNWTRDFAVTISRRALPNLAGAGIVPKPLENKRIRVRGWVEARTGPRMEVRRAGQIEVLGAN